MSATFLVVKVSDVYILNLCLIHKHICCKFCIKTRMVICSNISAQLSYRLLTCTLFSLGPSFVSDNFKYLLSLTSGSCWRFTAILANIFASQVVPPGTYNTLKLAILLSLVQTCEKENADYLDLLIVTSDTLVIDR